MTPRSARAWAAYIVRRLGCVSSCFVRRTTLERPYFQRLKKSNHQVAGSIPFKSFLAFVTQANLSHQLNALRDALRRHPSLAEDEPGPPARRPRDRMDADVDSPCRLCASFFGARFIVVEPNGHMETGRLSDDLDRFSEYICHGFQVNGSSTFLILRTCRS